MQINIDQIIRETAETTAKETAERVTAALKSYIENQQADRYVTYDECAALTAKPSADAFRMWLSRPDQAELKTMFTKVGKRPAILRSTFLAYLGRGR